MCGGGGGVAARWGGAAAGWGHKERSCPRSTGERGYRVVVRGKRTLARCDRANAVWRHARQSARKATGVYVPVAHVCALRARKWRRSKPAGDMSARRSAIHSQRLTSSAGRHISHLCNLQQCRHVSVSFWHYLENTRGVRHICARSRRQSWVHLVEDAVWDTTQTDSN